MTESRGKAWGWQAVLDRASEVFGRWYNRRPPHTPQHFKLAPKSPDMRGFSQSAGERPGNRTSEPPQAGDADQRVLKRVRQLAIAFDPSGGIGASPEAALTYLEDLEQALLEHFHDEDTLRSGDEPGSRAVADHARDLLRHANDRLSGDPDFDVLKDHIGFGAVLAGIDRDRIWTRIDRSDLAAFVRRPVVQGVLRAQALVTAYYPTRDEWGDFRTALDLAAGVLRSAATDLGGSIHHARLLVPISSPDARAQDADVVRLSLLAPLVRALAGTTFRPVEGRIALDWTTFGYESSRGGRAQSLFAGYTPAEWRGRN